jgi:hypothetical protein
VESPSARAKLIDWLDEITADCAKKRAGQYERSLQCEVSAIAEGAVVVSVFRAANTVAVRPC